VAEIGDIVVVPEQKGEVIGRHRTARKIYVLLEDGQNLWIDDPSTLRLGDCVRIKSDVRSGAAGEQGRIVRPSTITHKDWFVYIDDAKHGVLPFANEDLERITS
jgi:hypothetical protein